MRYLTLLAALLTAPAVAAPIAVANAGEYRLILMDDPCPAQIDGFFNLAFLREGSRKTYLACWRLNGEVVELIYEDGDLGRVPLAAFQKPESI